MSAQGVSVQRGVFPERVSAQGMCLPRRVCLPEGGVFPVGGGEANTPLCGRNS